MKIELFGYEAVTYGDLEDAQEDGAIHLLIDDAGRLNYTTLMDIKEIIDKSSKAFADKEIVLFVKMGGIDYSFEAITGYLEGSLLHQVDDIARHARNNVESTFEKVRASISWKAIGSTSKMVDIANSSNYIDLEPCSFCGKCDLCKVSESYFFYANTLTELDHYLTNYHADGWKINYYSVST